MSALTVKFDWYQCTIVGTDYARTFDALALRLAAELGGVLAEGRTAYGYAVCWEIVRDERCLCRVFGKGHTRDEVHLQVTSSSCVEVVPVIRRLFPAHRVSRVDACIDVREDFDRLDEFVTAVASESGVYQELIVNTLGGATRYLGSRQSPVRARLYKKSEELRARHPEAASEVPDGIVRFEVEVRPHSRKKADFAEMSPADVFGASRWTRTLLSRIFDLDVEPVHLSFRRPTSWQRTLSTLGRQYGPSVRQRAARVGTAAALDELKAAFGL